MKLLLSYLCLVCCTATLKAQSVINSSGTTLTSNTYNLEYSIGEISITTLTTTASFATQGLLQPKPKYLGPYCAIISAPMQTFPNPVIDKLRLVGQFDWITGYEVYAADGKLVRLLSFFNNYIDLTGLPRAIYFVRLYPGCNKDHKVLKVFKQ